MRLSAPTCRDFEAAAPFLPWEAQGGFVCAALKVPTTCRALLKGTERLQGNLLQCFSWLPAGLERMFFLHHLLGWLRNQSHHLQIQKLAIHKGLLLRWAGQPHFSEIVLLRTGKPERARVVLPQVTLAAALENFWPLSLHYGK